MSEKGKRPPLPGAARQQEFQHSYIGLPVFNCCYDVPDSYNGKYGMDQDEDEGDDKPSCFGEPEGIFCYICRFRKECEMNSRRAAS